MVRSLTVLGAVLVALAAGAEPPAGAEATGTSAPPGPGATAAASGPATSPPLRAELFGYAKLIFSALPEGPPGALVGGHTGFRVLNARVGLRLFLSEACQAVVSADAAVARRAPGDPLAGERGVALRDAFGDCALHPLLQLRGGQFKAPFGAEALMPDGALPFVTRSILNDGIQPPEGYPLPGLGMDRQVGVQLGSARLGGAFGIRYAVAVVNGNGANALLNDNGAVTPVARLVVDYGQVLAVGVGGYLNTVTEGTRPNLLTETHRALALDAALTWRGFQGLVAYLARSTRFEGLGLPDDFAHGVVAQASYLHHQTQLEAGVRFTRYEPSTAQRDDAVSELTLMVGHRLHAAPIRVLAQYTLRREAVAAQVDNDGLEAMLQVTF